MGDKNIAVTMICPGPVASELANHVIGGQPVKAWLCSLSMVLPLLNDSTIGTERRKFNQDANCSMCLFDDR
jgi:short-subunit dehydrogenase